MKEELNISWKNNDKQAAAAGGGGGGRSSKVTYNGRGKADPARSQQMAVER
jgi:hypothetical protein